VNVLAGAKLKKQGNDQAVADAFSLSNDTAAHSKHKRGKAKEGSASSLASTEEEAKALLEAAAAAAAEEEKHKKKKVRLGRWRGGGVRGEVATRTGSNSAVDVTTDTERIGGGGQGDDKDADLGFPAVAEESTTGSNSLTAAALDALADTEEALLSQRTAAAEHEKAGAEVRASTRRLRKHHLGDDARSPDHGVRRQSLKAGVRA
jgi:hypothetical protein